jgi:hypothetical protein
MDMNSLKVPAIGIGGVATGVGIGTLAGEFAAKSTGQKKYAALGVKAAVKSVIGGISYFGGQKLEEGMHSSGSFYAEMLAYGSIGSILLDVALVLYPGGIPGLAEDWAVTARVYAAGGRKTARKLSDLERSQRKPVPANMSSDISSEASVR